MIVFTEIAPARSALAQLARPLGFVPTMGALHAGHLRLIERSRAQCVATAVSLFVNPLQFGPGEDLARYPRDEPGDRKKLEAAGVDLLFAPDRAEIYPAGFSTSVEVGDLGRSYEGAARPAHFRGVATIVTKLLHIVEPNVLFLGQKDAQQTALLRRLVRDLNFDARVEVVETVREHDGLALSSRNAYLSASERTAAPSLHAALQMMQAELRRGSSVREARVRAGGILQAPGVWEYLDLVDAETFAPLSELRQAAFIIGAARLGQTRLLDNLMVSA